MTDHDWQQAYNAGKRDAEREDGARPDRDAAFHRYRADMAVLCATPPQKGPTEHEQ